MPAIDKLFSQIMVKRLAAHVPLHDHQYGFRKGRSAFDALFALHAAVEPRVRNGLLSCLLFLDWSKAYDRVMHAAFLDRLAAKGVTGKAWRLVDAMYKNAGAAGRKHVLGFPSDVWCRTGLPLIPLPVRCLCGRHA
jgi:Reverse transcriptase (RNA-dependent DNA polymerase)